VILFCSLVQVAKQDCPDTKRIVCFFGFLGLQCKVYTLPDGREVGSGGSGAAWSHLQHSKCGPHMHVVHPRTCCMSWAKGYLLVGMSHTMHVCPE
jgi:hypothetical protein